MRITRPWNDAQVFGLSSETLELLSLRQGVVGRTDFRWEACKFSFGNVNFEKRNRHASRAVWLAAGYRSLGSEERASLVVLC